MTKSVTNLGEKCFTKDRTKHFVTLTVIGLWLDGDPIAIS